MLERVHSRIKVNMRGRAKTGGIGKWRIAAKKIQTY
jgi:hypothetical protein